MLARLGGPEKALPPVVHVAGTNGKGSVISMLRAILEAAGARVHVYTSPHLVGFAERIRLAGTIIAEDALEAFLAECEEANGGEPITFFEITTAAALLAFARTPADVLLMEVGLGGRLDATNVIERPALSAITPVSIDHTQYLGTTLSAIASEKAGILKPGVVGVIGPQPTEALGAIESRAAEVGSPLSLAGRDWEVEEGEDSFLYRDGAEQSEFPKPALLGFHQIENAAMAIACVKRLEGFKLDDEAIGRGLKTVEWPGRLQRLESGPLPALLARDGELWLDGGHNAAAGLALAQTVRSWPRRTLHLVVGMLNTKRPEDFLSQLVGQALSISCVPVPNEPASFSAEEISDRVGHFDVLIVDERSVWDAVERIARVSRARHLKPGRVLVCGSLYLVGSVLAENGWAVK